MKHLPAKIATLIGLLILLASGSLLVYADGLPIDGEPLPFTTYGMPVPAPASGEGTISVSPLALSYGLTQINVPQILTLTLTNNSVLQSITINAINLSGTFSASAAQMTLQPGASTEIDVTFLTSETGVFIDVLKVKHSGTNSPINVEMVGRGYDPAYPPVNFTANDLQGAPLTNPTTLDFGSDGRLYVAEVDGMVYAYTIARQSATSYQVTAIEAIDLVQTIPNYNDDGSTDNVPFNQRQITGLLAVGTAQEPVVYVTSSDPRHATHTDTGLDTNSGIVSRLTKTESGWEKVDIVRGIPKSEENHSINGLVLDDQTQTLYVMVGGSTNKGAPGSSFSFTPEYALSGALLALDLNALESISPQTDAAGQVYVYNLPTLDDPTRGTPGQPDPGDPFGGNDGLNQAMIVPGGPVTVYATGLRNAYDIAFTDSRRLYTFDNGPNTNWGGLVSDEGPAGLCTNEPNAANSKGYSDNLHYIDGPGFFGGHPNPVRANPDGAKLYHYTKGTGGSEELDQIYDFTQDFTPVPFEFADARQCDFQAPALDDSALATLDTSTNGLTDYRATGFDGAMQGDLLSVSYSGDVTRFSLNEAGTQVERSETLFSGFGWIPLDITTQGDNEVFPGTIWAASYLSNNITVFEPTPFGDCIGAYSLDDEDNDNYTNADEIDNGTDPCSGGSLPDDFDKDFVSDRNDPDDDNDGIFDVIDSFALDSSNGLTTNLPVHYEFFNNNPGTGFFGLGFTGLMRNGSTNYSDQFNLAQLTPGGTSGKMTVEQVSSGSAKQTLNDQDNGFQIGLNIDSNKGPFTVQTRLEGPYFNTMTPAGGQAQGFYIGTGDQDNYLEICLGTHEETAGIHVRLEANGQTDSEQFFSEADLGSLLTSDNLDFTLEVNPGSNTAQPQVSISDGPAQNLGDPLTLPGGWFAPDDGQGLAAGLIATANGGETFAATWDYLRADFLQADPPSAYVSIDPTFISDINGSTYDSSSFTITNNASNGEKITNVYFNLNTATLPDIVFDPNGTAGDTTPKDFTADAGAGETGLTGHYFDQAFENGFYGLGINFNNFTAGKTFAFSVDVDPTSIQGTAAPGPGIESGSVSGLELVGATVTVTFENGSSYTRSMYRKDGTQDASENTFNVNNPAQPGVQVLGLSSPSTTANTNQTVRVTGPAGASVRLLVFEGALWQQPGGGFNISPYEVNSLVRVEEQSGMIGSGGSTDFNITLARTQGDVSGVHYITAVIESGSVTGATADPFIVAYDPNASNPPVANDDSYEMDEDDTLSVDEPGVLGNDTDNDSNSLSASIESNPSHGSVTLNTDGSFTYEPDANYAGEDSFVYRAEDGNGGSDIATVTITLNNLNDTPIANDDGYTVDEDTTLIVNAADGVLKNDADVDDDTLTAEVDDAPGNGQLTLNSDGSLSYVPDADFFGNDSFTYRVEDGNGASNSATVNLTINNVNDAPTAADDSYMTDTGVTLTVNAIEGILSNDGDLDGDSLSAVLTETAPAGLTFNSDGSFSYVPETGFFGTVTFDYRANDGTENSNTATVTISVGIPEGDELLTNGGFEIRSEENRRVPEGWIAKNLSRKDKIKCNRIDHPEKPDKIFAFAGDCTFQFKGEVIENSKIQYKPDVSTLNVGDTLNLTAYVWGKNLVAKGGRLQIKITYTDGEKVKENVFLDAGTYDYTAYTSEITLTKAIKKLRFQIKNRRIATSGKFRIDAVSLTRTPTSGLIPRGEWRGMPPPDEVDTERGR